MLISFTESMVKHFTAMPMLALSTLSNERPRVLLYFRLNAEVIQDVNGWYDYTSAQVLTRCRYIGTLSNRRWRVLLSSNVGFIHDDDENEEDNDVTIHVQSSKRKGSGYLERLDSQLRQIGGFTIIQMLFRFPTTIIRCSIIIQIPIRFTISIIRRSMAVTIPKADVLIRFAQWAISIGVSIYVLVVIAFTIENQQWVSEIVRVWIRSTCIFDSLRRNQLSRGHFLSI